MSSSLWNCKMFGQALVLPEIPASWLLFFAGVPLLLVLAFLKYLQQPDRPFDNFRASRSGDMRIYEVQECRVTDFEAPKLRKGR